MYLVWSLALLWYALLFLWFSGARISDPFEHCILKKTKKHTKNPLLPGEYKFNSNGSSGFNISRIGGYWANRFYGLHKSLALRHRGMRDGGELFPIVYQEDKTPSSRSSEWFQLWEQSVLKTNVSNLAIRLYHPNKLTTCLDIICIIYPRQWMPSDKEILTIYSHPITSIYS